jgi:hypothetical protein
MKPFRALRKTDLMLRIEYIELVNIILSKIEEKLSFESYPYHLLEPSNYINAYASVKTNKC